MSAPAVVVTQVTKRFGRTHAVDGLSATIAPGEAVALWGQNGAGKTTLLRCLLGVVPFEGDVRVFGHDVRREGRAARARIGYVPQDQSLQGDQTVGETLAFFAALRRVSRAALAPLIDTWDLGALLPQRVASLSGGMRQRVALAVALIGDPALLLLDEPTTHFDVRTRLAFAARLEALTRAGKTLIFCSHRSSDVRRLAGRVLVLEQGRLTASGTPGDVASWLQGDLLLGVTVREAQASQAAALLSARGLMVDTDGSQLWITGASARQAEVLQVLAQARIDVMDIELDSLRASRNGHG